MLLRRLVPLAAALGAVACAPSIQQDPSPTVDVAVFDPTNSKIPLPNDLVFQALPTLPPSAQTDLLTAFAAEGAAFPNDQEVPLTIDFVRKSVDPSTGALASTPAPLDVTSIKVCTAPGIACNMAVLQVNDLGVPSLVTLAPIVAGDFAGATLTLHNAGRLRWPTSAAAPARYIVAVRGGPNGVHTIGGGSLSPTAPFFLLLAGQDLSKPANQTLLPGSTADKLAAGTQLEAIRQAYLAPFQAIDALAFPRSELAVMSTFKIAQGLASVQMDPQLGVFPLPSDFLLDSTGHVQNLPSAFGALAPGIHTLDGFSTTAMILAQTSGLVSAASVNSGTVFLYKFNTNASGQVTGLTRLLDVSEALSVAHDPTKARFITEPSQITQSGASPVIGLQPAQPVQVQGFPPFAVPPLDESTEYGVVITDGVKDAKAPPGTSINSSTIAKALRAQHALVDSGGKSQLQGVSDAQAASLEPLRQAVASLTAQLLVDKGIDSTHVRTAYTFRTQSVTGKSNIGKTGPGIDVGVLGLAAAPYKPASLGQAAGYFTPGAIPAANKLTPAAAFNKYGIEQSGTPTTVPSSNIQEVLEVAIPTVNLLSPTTGAFGSPPVQDTVTALVSVPKSASVTAVCPVGYGLPGGTKCAPLVIFHHGLGGTKAQMLTVADSLNAQGLAVAAIDSPKHGDRAFCAKDSECEATGSPGTPAPAGACVPNPAFTGQGDAVVPGTCTGPGTNGLRHVPQLCGSTACQTAWGTYAVGSNGGRSSGQTLASANYLVTANFFRTRDTIRQDVLDNSALILALSLAPSLPLNSVQTELVANQVFIDPTNIQWLGQSYGSILGTINVAANPRLGKAVLNVGGGTVTDIFSTPGSSFYPTLIALLNSLTPPIVPGTSQYLQFINVAKWVLDPADPINFATHVTANTLPNLLNTVTPGAPQTAKAVLGQIARCDKTVPNQTNSNLYLDMGLGPLYTGTNPAASSTLTTFFDSAAAITANGCVGVGGSDAQATPHGFITSWGIDPAAATYDATVNLLTGDAQSQAAAFLSAGTLPPNNVSR
jgi:hypothetical protein